MKENRLHKKYGFVFISIIVIASLIISGCSAATSGDKPSKIVLDYATYSPTSLVLKEFGWVEEAFAEEGIDVEFIQSQGSNQALEYLASRSVDFGSTAGAAALISKSRGVPIEAIYVYSKPEWTALVTASDSSITQVSDLKGKTVAATTGTDPFIFLLRALAEHDVAADDVRIVHLQHGDGARALSTGEVDAWAGLDPHMARLELDENAQLFYRNPGFNTYGFLNVRSAFAEQYPEYVEKVIELYEKARLWTLENPEEAAAILAKHAQLSEEVANVQLTRNDFSEPILGDVHVEALKAAGIVLQKDDIINDDVDLDEIIKQLINSTFAQNVIQK